MQQSPNFWTSHRIEAAFGKFDKDFIPTAAFIEYLESETAPDNDVLLADVNARKHTKLIETFGWFEGRLQHQLEALRSANPSSDIAAAARDDAMSFLKELIVDAQTALNRLSALDPKDDNSAQIEAATNSLMTKFTTWSKRAGGQYVDKLTTKLVDTAVAATLIGTAAAAGMYVSETSPETTENIAACRLIEQQTTNTALLLLKETDDETNL